MEELALTVSSMLAELMLPDGTHTRDQDWTIFFLHKDTAETPTEPGGQTPLIYVLNLVITKHDKEAKRHVQILSRLSISLTCTLQRRES